MMEKTFLNPATNKKWRIEIDGHTIRTCLDGGKVKEIFCDSVFQVKSKAAYRVTEGEYVLVDLKSAQKVVIPNEGWHPFFSPDDQCFSVDGKFYLTQTGEEMDDPFPFSVRQGLSFSDTCAVRTRGSLMAVQQERGSSPIELWDTGSGQLLATIDDSFVVRQVNFAFTKSGLVLHTDYGAMSIYSCAL